LPVFPPALSESADCALEAGVFSTASATNGKSYLSTGAGALPSISLVVVSRRGTCVAQPGQGKTWNMVRIVTLLLGLALLAQSAAAQAQESGPEQVAYGAGSFLGTLVYTPIKGSFCILGAIAAGFAFPVAGSDGASDIAGTTCKGTWVITPSALQGREDVRFVG
jgi:hypothetical protein